MITIKEVKKELSKYSIDILKHFEELFPCNNLIKEIEIQDKYYCQEIDRILLKMDGVDENIKFNIISAYKPLDTIYIGYETIEELWKRWNKYLVLRVFL